MGLIGKGVKYGGLFLVAREGIKAVEKHNDNKRAQQASQSLPYTNQQPQPTPYAYQQPPYAQQSRDIQSQYQYQDQPIAPQAGFHQVWCNGRCEGRCGAKEALMALQQPQQQYRDEKQVPPSSY